MSAKRGRWLAVAAFALASSGAVEASAYCRTTTCDPTQPAGCPTDDEGCETTGLPLYWASNCVTVSVQGDGAPTQNIDYDTAAASVQRAFATWTSVDCFGAPPSITVDVQGPVQCDKSEYNSDRGNANIVLFREDKWPYGAGAQDALGVTFVNFDPSSGEIWDVDVEINAIAETLSTDPGPNDVDLDSVLTHEAGHLLGLAHTKDQSATMFPAYHPGSTSLRNLGYDDVAGLCAIYPSTRTISSTSCTPRHGFSPLCGADQPDPVMTDDTQPAAPAGCSASARRPTSAFALLGALSLACAARFARRRRRH